MYHKYLSPFWLRRFIFPPRVAFGRMHAPHLNVITQPFNIYFSTTSWLSKQHEYWSKQAAEATDASEALVLASSVPIWFSHLPPFSLASFFLSLTIVLWCMRRVLRSTFVWVYATSWVKIQYRIDLFIQYVLLMWFLGSRNLHFYA